MKMAMEELFQSRQQEDPVEVESDDSESKGYQGSGETAMAAFDPNARRKLIDDGNEEQLQGIEDSLSKLKEELSSGILKPDRNLAAEAEWDVEKQADANFVAEKVVEPDAEAKTGEQTTLIKGLWIKIKVCLKPERVNLRIMNDEDELQLSEMLHDYMNGYGCIASEEDLNPFWKYCQTRLATRFSVRQLRRKTVSFYQQQTSIMKSCELNAGANIPNAAGQNVLTSSAKPAEDQQDAEGAVLLQTSAQMATNNHPSNGFYEPHSDAEQDFVFGEVRCHSVADQESIKGGVDDASAMHYPHKPTKAGVRLPNKNLSEDYLNPFHYCQTLLATRFSVQHLKRKIFSIYQQQRDIVESGKLDAGAITENFKHQNVLTFSPTPTEDHRKSQPLCPKRSTQKPLPSSLNEEQEVTTGVDSASPLRVWKTATEADTNADKNSGVILASPLSLLQTPVDGDLILLSYAGLKLAKEETKECSHLPAAYQLTEPANEEKLLLVIDGTNHPRLCHVDHESGLPKFLAAQESLSSNKCMELCKLGNSDLQSTKTGSAHTYGEGAGMKVRDTTLLDNLAECKGSMSSLWNKVVASSTSSLACSDECVPALQPMTLNPCKKRRAEVSMLEWRHQIETLKQSARIDLAQTMAILSQISLPPQ
ncbi:hypothetical protein L7F22_051892 [Adiantum nelumboides]|nr:hypothetical protein [Adiantum nelumboides]